MLNLEYYSFRVNPSNTDYDFLSVGPRGTIKKIVRFSKMGNGAYNFAFGDLNESRGEINDIAVTGNEDMEKVLATLAFIVIDFTRLYPEAIVFVRGSTASRTRLYQIYIGKYIDQIEPVFDIRGYCDGVWEKFRKGRNYSYFLGRRK